MLQAPPLHVQQPQHSQQNLDQPKELCEIKMRLAVLEYRQQNYTALQLSTNDNLNSDADASFFTSMTAVQVQEILV